MWVHRAWLKLSVAQLVRHAASSCHHRCSPNGCCARPRFPLWKELRSILSQLVARGIATVWLIDANLTMGSVQSEAVGSYQPEHDSEVGAECHSLLTTWDMVLPATFHHDPTGAGTWCSDSGVRRGYDYVALSRKHLPSVASVGDDTSVQVHMNIIVDHLLTQATSHVPTVETATVNKSEACSKFKCRHPSRALLQFPEVRQAIEDDIAPPPHTAWSVD